MIEYLVPLAGGMLIGLSAAMLLLFNGRIAGISGILGRLANGVDMGTNAAFVVGLVCGPVAFAILAGHAPVSTVTASWPLIVIGGLLVGFGSRMGSGCTSGHGVLGLALLSPRSLAAVATFLASGIVTVAILKGLAP